jgi:hypothetical protein
VSDILALGSTNKYTSKQNRKASKIERRYKKRRVSRKKPSAAPGQRSTIQTAGPQKRRRDAEKNEASQAPARAEGKLAAGPADKCSNISNRNCSEKVRKVPPDLFQIVRIPNGAAFVSVLPFLQRPSAISRSVEPLRAAHVARALSSTLTVGSRALAHAWSPGNVLWRSFCGRGAP